MRDLAWVDLIHHVAKPENIALLTVMAQHLSDCERAFEILRTNGYGEPGMSIIEVASAVPKKA